MTQPRAPRRFSWAIAGRLVRGVAVAFMLVWLVALVAWPERHVYFVSVSPHGFVNPIEGSGPGRLVLVGGKPATFRKRDRDISVLLDLLAELLGE